MPRHRKTVDMTDVLSHIKDIKTLAPSRIKDALNRSIIASRTLGIKEIKEVVNIKVASIKSRIKTTLATSSNRSAKLTMKYKKHPNLGSFKFSVVSPAKGRKKMPKGGVKSRAWTNKGRRQKRNSTGAILHKGTFVWKRAGAGNIVLSRVKGAGKVAPSKGSYAGKRIKVGPRAGQPVLRQPLKPIFGPEVKTEFEGAFFLMSIRGEQIFKARILNSLMNKRS